MSFEYKLTLNDIEKRTLLEWGDDIFASEQFNLIWRPKDLHLVMYQQDMPVSKCGLLRQTIRVGSHDLEVAGIGGVVTAPECQNQGFATQLIDEALRFVETEWLLSVSALFCRNELVPFYQQLGWKGAEREVMIVQPHGSVRAPMNFLVYEVAPGSWPGGAVELGCLPW
ncbi:GNAT family N-acetyltransferase [Aurantivibrio plasticivorans]